MIHQQAKRYQIDFWLTEDRSASEPALRLEFDSFEEAMSEFDRCHAAGLYGSGLFIEWRKGPGEWELVDRFPK